jgi:uridine kinase
MRRTWEAGGEGPDTKYDFGYMRAIIRAVCANRDPERHVVAPKYDATTGKALASDRRRYIPPVDMLIIEGDMLGEHGVAPDALYPDDLDLDAKTLYLHLPDTERLAYRVNRDMEHRNGHGETPEIIADNFESRQLKQHLPYTLGYAAAADCIVRPVNLAPDIGRHYDVWQMQSAAIAAQ